VRRFLLLVGLGCLLVTLCSCDLQQTPGGNEQPTGIGTLAAPLSGPTTDGTQLAATTTQGRITVVDFWGSWCGPCRAEQADINALHDRYHGRGVVFVGVDMRDDNASANAYRRDFKVGYTSIDDGGGAIAGAYNVTAPPELDVIDRTGHIAGRFLGTVVGVSAALDRALS
jgi:thiol-disulfide isomerase/thioredoxin